MINTAAIANLLRPGLRTVFGEGPTYPPQWKEVFTTYESTMAYEQDQEMKFLGLAQIRAEGAPVAFDTMGQRYEFKYWHKDIGLGYQITQNTIDDNQYESQFPRQARALKSSLEQTKEVIGADVLNNAWDPEFLQGDNVTLFSTQHPIDGGVVANTAAIPADLNEASLEQAIITIQQFRDQSGLIRMTKPRKMIVPPQLQFVAEKLLKSAYSPDTGNNAVNPIFTMGVLPDGYRVNQFLTNPDAWFVLTDCQDGLKHFQRKAYESDMYNDFATGNLMVKAIERYSFGCTDFRAIYGSGNLPV